MGADLPAYLLPLTALFLAVSVGALGFRAERRRGYGPFIVGVLAGTLLLLGKFAADAPEAVYGSLVLLIGASAWTAWPIRSTTGARSAPAEPQLQLGSLGVSTMTTKRKIEVFSAGCPACDAKLADCCAGRGPEEPTQRAAGLGQPIS
jgi:hypothetical protein